MNSVAQTVAKLVIKSISLPWKPYSRLILYGDSSGWVLDWEMRELKAICGKLGLPVVNPLWKHARHPQSIFYSNQFFLQNDDWLNQLPHRIGLAYFHGLPGTGNEGFDRVYANLKKHHEKLARIQVSHTEMRNAVLQAGIDPAKVFQIPIGINMSFFPFRNDVMKTIARQQLGVPQSAFVIGSFQKDGVGWDEGLQPKLEKGPDVFVKTVNRLKAHIPQIHVLLSGPARGFVKKGLAEAGIACTHVYLKDYPDIARLYQALDLYIVASRQEGGPKAILESMASGVPLITTRVGQAMDLVLHGKNALMTDVEDVDALTACVLQVYRSDSETLAPMLAVGRATAEANSYDNQIPLWAAFMKGFVE